MSQQNRVWPTDQRLAGGFSRRQAILSGAAAATMSTLSVGNVRAQVASATTIAPFRVAVPQLRAAFEIYRAFPQDARWNAAQTAPNSTPLVVTVGEKSFSTALLSTFVEGYRARGMSRVKSAQIPDAGHYLLADNPEAVARLIEEHAGSDAR
ncbi:alpha/beta fold hydrolase [Sphingomonas sp. DT-204]|uniref:alpha/beta fold hydrolase n=1 Tax=Sphingomonas sp. DT-204 TaxID=3396166 RepID=UPI003F1C1F16